MKTELWQVDLCLTAPALTGSILFDLRVDDLEKYGLVRAPLKGENHGQTD